MPKPFTFDGAELREMTDAEHAQYIVDQSSAELEMQDAKAKAKEKQAILKRLGLTANELDILLS